MFARRPGARALRPDRPWLALALALALAACGEGEGPIGSPGGRNGVEMSYETPRVQVVESGDTTRVTLSIRVRRTGDGGAAEPWVGASLTVERTAGTGRLMATRAGTDANGVASVELLALGPVDRTHVDFILEGDRRSHLPFDVITAPVVPVDLPLGGVADLDPPRGGAILRLAVEPGVSWVLMPIHLDPDRTGVPYRLLHSRPGPGAAAGVTMGAAPPIGSASRPSVRSEDRGHIVEGELDPGALVASSAIPAGLSIRSCMIEATRVAPLRYVGRTVAIYVDGPPDQHQARIDSLGAAFDDSIFPTNSALYGPTTDRDANGVVYIIMSPELKGIGGVYCDSIRIAGVEVFHAVWNPQDPIDRTLGTLAHEHQHVVNASWHFASRGAIGDERWLNEALSYSAEPRNGYWGAPLVRVWQFLSGQNGGVGMLPFQYASHFNDEYMMLLTYLGDRFGPEFYRRLGSSGLWGPRNVSEAAGLPFDSLVRDWLVASGVSGRDPDIPERYRYRTFDLHGMADEIEGCGCLPPGSLDGMYLEPLGIEASFDVFRFFDGYDADYYRIDASGNAGGTVDLYFDAFGMTSVRLSVARVRDPEAE